MVFPRLSKSLYSRPETPSGGEIPFRPAYPAAGCYVSPLKEIIAEVDQPLSLLNEDDVESCLALLRKALSGGQGLPLLRGGQGRLRPEHPADELPVEQLRLAHVVQRVVEVGGAVVKGGPQEAHLRRGGQPSGGFHVEGVFVGHVAQPRLPLPHGADGAQQGCPPSRTTAASVWARRRRWTRPT